MVFIPISERPTSSFIDLDDIFGDEDFPFTHQTGRVAFEACYNDLYKSLEVGDKISEKIQERPGLTPFQESESDQNPGTERTLSDRAKVYHVIKACCGDDCISVSNCSAFMPTVIAVCDAVLGLTISEPDVGNSSRIASYTQGFILAPLSPVSNFSSVNDFIGQKAVPWTFDLPDAKRYSGVRKQSEENSDFSSKYIYIAQAADWVDRDWITYDLHQLGKIFAMLTLDFRGARAHPYIYKAEGGCGSIPPWGNIGTAISSFFFFQRGKECSALLLALQESTSIRRGNLAPRDSNYLQLIHQAQNSHLWSALYHKFHSLKSMGYSHIDVRDMIDRLLEKEVVPQELIDKSVEVFPRSTLVGMAIAQMRNFGLIMTELDVQNHIAKRKKFQLMTGTQPLGPIFQQEEEELRLNRKKGNSLVLKLTTALSEDHIQLAESRRFARANIRSILLDYYAAHPGHFLSSFIYADGVRIYRSTDVVNFVDHDERKMFLESLELPVIAKSSYLTTSYQPINQTQAISFEKAISFAKDLNLNIFNDNAAELPFIGAADPLVLREAIRVQGEFMKAEQKISQHILVIVSEDKYLVWSVSQYMKKYQVPVLYIAGKWMYDWISRDPESTSRMTSGRTANSDKFFSFEIKAFGMSRRLTSLDCEFIHNIAGSDKDLPVQISFVFDYPNIRRRLGLVSRSRNTIQDQGHSWLDRRAVRSAYGIAGAIGFRYFHDMNDFMSAPKNQVSFRIRRDDHIRVMSAPIDRPFTF